MDRSCQAQLLAEGVGAPKKIDHATALGTRTGRKPSGRLVPVPAAGAHHPLRTRPAE
jgi:hypothetical protein